MIKFQIWKINKFLTGLSDFGIIRGSNNTGVVSLSEKRFRRIGVVSRYL